jgi:hypothetical protein
MFKAFTKSSFIVLVAVAFVFSGCSYAIRSMVESSSHKNAQSVENVKAGKFDTGRMWTFDNPPVDYFKTTYGFTPDKAWFEKARLGTLRLPGCTSSFVSEDGLVMTNHHCARGALVAVTKEGEKLATEGFYAKTLEEERKSPVTFIDQLVLIEDVTSEMQTAFDSGTSDTAKTANRTAKQNDIMRRFALKFKQSNPSDSMSFTVYSFYNGGRYSLYGFKRFTDVRLVFAPEEEIAFYGGDPDNYTYPRYDFDVSFFRVYEHGKPYKTRNFFPFSKNGAADGEAVFVTGNPGTTHRLNTVSQLETLRDYTYPFNVESGGSRFRALSSYIEKHPEKRFDYVNTIFGIGNTLKRYIGYLDGLKDPVLMAKKVDFENTFRAAVTGNPQLSSKYGDPWDEIGAYERGIQALRGEANALNIRNWSSTLSLASGLIDNALGQTDFRGRPAMKPPFPRDYAAEVEKMLLVDQLTYMQKAFAETNEAFNALLSGRTPEQAAAALMSSSVFGSKEKYEAFAAGKQDDIMKSTDPVMLFAKYAVARSGELQAQIRAFTAKQQPLLQLLGKAMYDVYGASIPPDATFSLRIADGVVNGYEYNGTVAPIYTTFYGMYDRYYSFGKKDPWNLPARWANPPSDFKMSTPLDFVSTNDIIGGNSGSPVVNKKLEVVGLVFDGNIESLPGDIIFDESKNRSVAVHSSGIIEGIDKIYRAERIAKELRAAKIVN